MNATIVRALITVTGLSLAATACGSNRSARTDAEETSAQPQDSTVEASASPSAGQAASETSAPDPELDATSRKVGFILPDSKSSRWEAFDRKYIGNACDAIGIECDVQNAEGDKAKMGEIANEMISSGVKVLALVNLDSPSAVAIQEKAAAAGVKLIDYDRLTLNGKTDVFVSFDRVAVGRAQGEGMIACLGGSNSARGQKIIQLHGSPTDTTFTLYKQGYQEALKDSGIVTAAEEAVPDSDAQKGGVVFEQLLAKAGKVDGVLAANDALSLAAQAVLTKAGMTLPTTGQDATRDSLAAILSGTQCMTVYKPVRAEAEAAVAVAAALLGGTTPSTKATINDGAREIPYVQTPITPVYRDNVKDVVADGYVSAAELCTGDVAAKCAESGIS